MVLEKDVLPDSVIGPLGEKLTLDNLPPSTLGRWVARRKAQVVAAVNGGLLSVSEACERYDLTVEELASWQRLVERDGMLALRVTKIQHYRRLHQREGRSVVGRSETQGALQTPRPHPGK